MTDGNKIMHIQYSLYRKVFIVTNFVNLINKHSNTLVSLLKLV